MGLGLGLGLHNKPTFTYSKQNTAILFIPHRSDAPADSAQEAQLTDADGYDDEPHEGHEAEVEPVPQALHGPSRHSTDEVRDGEAMGHVWLVDCVCVCVCVCVYVCVSE